MGGTCCTNGRKRYAYRLLVGKKEKEAARKTKAWVGRGDVDWIGLAQDRDRWRALVNSVLNGSIKCWETMECHNNWWALEWCSAP
jgi:hypothetical protein